MPFFIPGMTFTHFVYDKAKFKNKFRKKNCLPRIYDFQRGDFSRS